MPKHTHASAATITALDPATQAKETRLGVIYAIICYGTWGFFPLYWSLLNGQDMSAAQLMGYRVIWATVWASLLLIITGQQHHLLAALKSPKTVFIFFLAAMALGSNWLIYIYGVSINRVIEASLGYFMSPLMSIALARIFIGEKINRWQIFAVILACFGVLWLAILAGQIPWIALWLSISWSLYSLIRKKVSLAPIPGLTLETLLMLPLAVIYLAWLNNQGEFRFFDLAPDIMLIVIGTGLLTTYPLVFFAAAAKRIRLNTLGILMYINPTMQFLMGLLVLKEPFDSMRFIAYIFVWIAVIIYAGSSYIQFKKAHAQSQAHTE